ncbi:MAG: DUF4199 domain-containing protein [Raineya sp.]|jgi:hypothetical protein|nr:DUF4199 domain-containing protein [Raineya sp.]
MTTENISITTSKVAIRYGLVYGLVAIAISIITTMANLRENSLVNIFTSIIWIAFIVLAVKYFKDNSEGFITLGQGFGIGLLVSVIGNVISGIFLIIYFKLINPELWEQQLEKIRAEWEKQGLDEQAMEFAENFVTPQAMLLFSILGALLLGSVFSVVIAAIMQKKKPAF